MNCNIPAMAVKHFTRAINVSPTSSSHTHIQTLSQQVTVIQDTEIQDNESVFSRSVSRTRSEDYRMLQPHPDSITPSKQRPGNKENEGDFHVNIPETESFNRRKEKRYPDQNVINLVH
eukprot:912868_1